MAPGCVVCQSKNVAYCGGEKEKFVEGVHIPESKWYICGNCAAFFQFPQPDSLIIRRLWDTSFHTEDGLKHMKSMEDKRAPAVFRRIIDKLPPGFRAKKSLDIGCGSGGLVEQFKKNGFSAYGLERDPKLRKHWKMRGIRVFNSTFEDFSGNEKFDIVTCNQSLFYYLDPQGVMEKISRITKKGGYLFIEQSCPLANPAKPNFSYGATFYLNPNSAKYLFSLHGFSTVYCSLRGPFLVILGKKTDEVKFKNDPRLDLYAYKFGYPLKLFNALSLNTYLVLKKLANGQ